MVEIEVGDRVTHQVDHNNAEADRDHGTVTAVSTLPWGRPGNMVTWIYVQWASRPAGEIDKHPDGNIKHCTCD